MIRRTFDRNLPMDVVLYLRMSSDSQNPRSPQQQQETIEALIRLLGLPWRIVEVYIDSGISGRLVRRRPGFQKMCQDIAEGKVQAQAILVDTFERFGRAEEMSGIRNRFLKNFGVLVLTADSRFEDPTSIGGRAMAMMESIRSTEDTRIKAHNVLRGKRDSVQQGRWPGGAAPFDYKLHSTMIDRNGRQELDYCTLVPDPGPAAVILRMYTEAAELGLGCTRITQRLNADPAITAKYGKFHDQTVNNWLGQSIYMGTYVWGKFATDIVNDRRVRERNSADSVIRIPNFCEPIVPEELWNRVQVVRVARRERLKKRTQTVLFGESARAGLPVPGVAIKYLLSGLVRCGYCGRAMVCGSSSPYESSSGEIKRYVYYFCPGRPSRQCHNKKRITESWLRETVVSLIRRRLFPSSIDDGTILPTQNVAVRTLSEGGQSESLSLLIAEVENELRRRDVEGIDPSESLNREAKELEAQLRGWYQSLGNPALDGTLRGKLESEAGKAHSRQAEITRLIESHKSAKTHSQQIVNPKDITDRLNRLADVLARQNPSRGNIELSLHIDRIICYLDGRVVVRTCKLGALSGAVDLLAVETVEADAPLPDGKPMVSPRRLAIRKGCGADALDSDFAEIADVASDANRFAGLGEEWFWQDEFQHPRVVYWAEANAMAVAQKRMETGWTVEKLSEFFARSMPTIRCALNHARRLDADFAKLPRKMPKRSWADEYGEEVLRLHREGMSDAELVTKYGKCKAWIRKTIRLTVKRLADRDQAAEPPTE